MKFQSEDLLLLLNMVLNTQTVAFFRSFAIFSGFFNTQELRAQILFCETSDRKMQILLLKVAKLQLNFGILLQNCDWNFS